MRMGASASTRGSARARLEKESKGAGLEKVKEPKKGEPLEPPVERAVDQAVSDADRDGDLSCGISHQRDCRKRVVSDDADDDPAGP